ncbi:MAG: glycosyltransferase family 4 protein [Solirubrobacterales bacterium]
MRVLMLAWEYPPRVVGGLAMHAYDLSVTLSNNGHEVCVITCGSPGVPVYEAMDGVQVYRVQPYDLPSRDIVRWATQLNVAMLEKAVQLFSQETEFDVIHAHDWLVAFAARALKHAYRLPLVVTMHATEYGRNNGIHNEVQRDISNIEWWLTYESWRVICCSGYMKGELQRVFNLPEDKIALIPNGVYPERFKQLVIPDHFKSRFALPHERIIYYVGRLVQEKGVQVLIDAAGTILAGCPDAKFVIAGTGPYEHYLKSKARDLGLGEKVHFTGYLNDEDRDALYKLAEIAVFPSLYEPFGIVALEAMAAGTPVIVSDSGGLAEIVRNNEDGLYTATGSAPSLANQVLRLLHTPGFAGQIALRAREKVEACYDWRVIARQTAEVYEAVLMESKQQGWGEPEKARWNPLNKLFGERRRRNETFN